MPLLFAIIASVSLAALLYLAVGVRSLRRLRDLPVPVSTGQRVSVVIAARNEAAAIERALTSVLALTDVEYEVIVVNDRSTDDTGKILARTGRDHPRLQVINNEELPDGWLGKNFALQLGARHATGDFILFTDADIVFEPTALVRALSFAIDNQLDLVAATPDAHIPGYWGSAFFGEFALNFGMAVHPWLARYRHTPFAVGVGAFNLVRTSAYHAIDGHARLAMRPDDDVRLALALKRAGFRQDVLVGSGMLSVEWYPGILATIRGLEKNTFAALNYSLPLTIIACSVHNVLRVWPWLALVAGSGAPRFFAGAACLFMLLSWLVNARVSGIGMRYAAAMPITALLFEYTVLRSAIVTLRQGGIRWRDTHYPLEQLRSSKIGMTRLPPK